MEIRCLSTFFSIIFIQIVFKINLIKINIIFNLLLSIYFSKNAFWSNKNFLNFLDFWFSFLKIIHWKSLRNWNRNVQKRFNLKIECNMKCYDAAITGSYYCTVSLHAKPIRANHLHSYCRFINKLWKKLNFGLSNIWGKYDP